MAAARNRDANRYLQSDWKNRSPLPHKGRRPFHPYIFSSWRAGNLDKFKLRFRETFTQKIRNHHDDKCQENFLYFQIINLFFSDDFPTVSC